MSVHTGHRHHGDTVEVIVTTPGLGNLTAWLPADRRAAIQVLQVLTDELPGAVDRALGDET